MKNQKKTPQLIPAFALALLVLAGGSLTARAQETGSKDQGKMESEGGMAMSGMMKNCPMMKGMGGQMQGGQMQGDMQGGMMGGGMMGMMMKRMMSDPVRQSVIQVYLLPTLSDSLNLSTGQTARLREGKKQFAAQHAQIQEDQKAKKKQLRETLSAEQPDLEQARALLDDQAALKADAKIAAVEAAARMKDVLSGEQREALGALKPMQMHRAMMANMSMMDMMQMMKAMPMMQGGGMMQNSGGGGGSSGMMNGNGSMRMDGDNQSDDENQSGGNS